MLATPCAMCSTHVCAGVRPTSRHKLVRPLIAVCASCSRRVRRERVRMRSANLETELIQARRAGHASADRQDTLNSDGIGAGIHDRTGTVVAAIGVQTVPCSASGARPRRRRCTVASNGLPSATQWPKVMGKVGRTSAPRPPSADPAVRNNLDAGSAVMNGVACNGWRFWTVESDEPVADPSAPAAAQAMRARPPPPKRRS